MDKNTKQAISASITPETIKKTTRALAYRFGEEIAVDAIGEALVRTCEWYDPLHKSEAAASTYFIKIAQQLAMNAYRDYRELIDFDERCEYIPRDTLDENYHEFHQEPAWLRQMQLVENTIARLRQMRISACSASQASYIILAEKVVRVLVDLLDADEDNELPLGDRERGDLYTIIGKQLGKKPNTVKNAMMFVQLAAKSANADECRTVRASRN